MQYTEEVLDRSIGELITRPIGDWVTVTELGELYGVSRIRVRAVLRQMGFLYVTGGQARTGARGSSLSSAASCPSHRSASTPTRSPVRPPRGSH